MNIILQRAMVGRCKDDGDGRMTEAPASSSRRDCGCFAVKGRDSGQAGAESRDHSLWYSYIQFLASPLLIKQPPLLRW